MKPDIQITKAIGGDLTQPAAYAAIFERGKDPDVDDPEICHDHSEIPETWPPLGDIVRYQKRVRDRIASLIGSGAAESDRKLGRSLWLAFEHEAMHLETYLYMLLQNSKIVSPPESTKPDFEMVDAEAEANSTPNKWFRVPRNKLTMGLEDPENALGTAHYFGWDNEKPPREICVGEFEAQGRPISNGEYVQYLKATGSAAIPASWTVTESKIKQFNGFHNDTAVNGVNGTHHDRRTCQENDLFRGISVRTVYGPIHLQYARHWPVMASYDELVAYAKWSNGRIPTLEEARSIYSHVDGTKLAIEEEVSSSLISAVNG
jgi:L-histidine Nalpha-methyltransferase / hercynylcysteine S-oxide synthase